MNAPATKGPVAWPLRIYYDARCPLCARELGILAAHDANERLQLVDCSMPGFADAATHAAGLDARTLMERIHACDADGMWHSGVAVFEAAYGAAGLHGVARVFAHPWLRPLWERLYPWIAGHRTALSRLGLDRPFGWVVTRAARRAARRAQRCATSACTATTHDPMP